jgi:hypothetical protein
MVEPFTIVDVETAAPDPRKPDVASVIRLVAAMSGTSPATPSNVSVQVKPPDASADERETVKGIIVGANSVVTASLTSLAEAFQGSGGVETGGIETSGAGIVR